MTVSEPFAPGLEVQQYRILDRVGAFVWRAEDRGNGKQVALKILTHQLPSDPGQRDGVFRHVSVRAALYHPFLVPVTEVITAGDMLLLVMDVVDGEPLRNVARRGAAPGADVLRVACQLADVLKFLHQRDVVHGNVSGDSVLLQDDGRVRLGGLNLSNLMRRQEGTNSAVLEQKGSDTRAVTYMAPEQIAREEVSFRSDVFSFGVALYELATGASPWPGANAAGVAEAKLGGKLVPPLVRKPDLDAYIASLIDRCLSRDQSARPKDGRVLVDELAERTPDAAAFAVSLAARANAELAGVNAGEGEQLSILLLASSAAPSVSARMQQVVGEAAYLFDGRVIDPFGDRVVAEMPTVEAAVQAGRKAEFDLINEELNGNELPVRLLLHAGRVSLEGGRASGDAIERGFAALEQIPERQLLLSEAFVKRGRRGLRLHDAGARAGMKLYEITEDRAPSPLPHADSISTRELPPLPPPGSRRRRSLTIAAIGLLLLVGGSAGLFWSARHRAAPVPRAAAPPTARVRAIAIEPLAVEGAEPVMLQRAAAIRKAAIAIASQIAGVQLRESGGPGIRSFGGAIRAGAAGPEFVPIVDSRETGRPVPLTDDATAVQALVACIAREVGARPATSSPAAINAWVAALAAVGEDDHVRASEALRAAAAADPSFLPVQLAAFDFFSTHNDDADAFAAAKNVLAAAPDHAEAARLVGRGSLARADVPAALLAYATLLRSQPRDAEALRTIGGYALSAGDAPRFQRAVSRLTAVMADDAPLHEPDLLAAGGRFDDAVQQYYDLEVKTPDNADLALKIGRVAVLRHTPAVAKLELEKLKTSDPRYGYHLLRAYIAAGEGQRSTAESELAEALRASRPLDTYWTSAAEVHAILGDSRKVVASLQTALQRREPTINYVLANPLFTYLASDASMTALRQALEEQQAEIRAALAKIAV